MAWKWTGPILTAHLWFLSNSLTYMVLHHKFLSDWRLQKQRSYEFTWFWKDFIVFSVPSVPWNCWFGVRKSIRPVKKLSDEVLARLSVWSKMQMIRMWSSWCYCHPNITCFIKTQNGLTFWCRLTQTVLKKKLLNGCLSVCLLSIKTHNLFVDTRHVFANGICKYPDSLLGMWVETGQSLNEVVNERACLREKFPRLQVMSMVMPWHVPSIQWVVTCSKATTITGCHCLQSYNLTTG